MKIEIYDPAMCCSSGVCGPSVDPELLRVQEVLRQIQKQAPEVTVVRYGLAAEPQAFVDNHHVAELLKSEGPDCLPLAFVEGKLVSKGAYPGNEQLQALLRDAGITVSLDGKNTGACCCAPGCC